MSRAQGAAYRRELKRAQGVLMDRGLAPYTGACVALHMAVRDQLASGSLSADALRPLVRDVETSALPLRWSLVLGREAGPSTDSPGRFRREAFVLLAASLCGLSLSLWTMTPGVERTILVIFYGALVGIASFAVRATW